MRRDKFKSFRNMFVAGCVILCIYGCSKDSKDSGGSTAKSVDTWIVDASEADGTATIRYSSNTEDAKFKCMIETENQSGLWQDCPTESIQFPTEPGVKYTFKVKAITSSGTEDQEPYSYTFIAGGKLSFESGKLETLILDKTDIGSVYSKDSLKVFFMAVGDNLDDSIRFECRRESEPSFRVCPEGDAYTFTQLNDGMDYSLSVRAVHDATETVATEDQISFNVQLSQNIEDDPEINPEVSSPVVQDFQIGSFYNFQIPERMHITEYSTTKNTAGALSFYRIMSESDPYYIGNYACNRGFDRMVSRTSPSGDALTYCNSTPRQNFYKWMNDFRLANNHIEVATDSSILDRDPSDHEIIMINVFDRDREFMQKNSRFDRLCLNPYGTVVRTAYPVTIGQDFFMLDHLRAHAWACDVDLSGSGPQWGQSQQWLVVGFFITDKDSNFPNILGPHFVNYKNPSLLEVVYMVRRNAYVGRLGDAVRSMQQRLIPNLQRLQP